LFSDCVTKPKHLDSYPDIHIPSPTVNSSSVIICISLLLPAEGQIINSYDPMLAKSLNGPNVSQTLYTLNKAIIIHLFSAQFLTLLLSGFW